MESVSSQRAQQEKNENQIYLESNELNKLMEILMTQIRSSKPDDIVSSFITLNNIAWVFGSVYETTIRKESYL